MGLFRFAPNHFGFKLFVGEITIMHKALKSIAFVTAALLVYIAAIRFNAVSLAIFIFSISPLLVVWMVFAVLRAPVKVVEGFEEGKSMYSDKEVR